MALNKTSNKHLKAILIGSGIFACIGSFLGYMVGFTVEGASSGFVVGWIIGEVFGLAAKINR